MEFWSFPEQQDLRKKLERRSSPDDSQADPNKESSDWSEIVEAEQSPFADASKASVYSSVDLRALDSAAKARSFLAFKIKSFGMKNGTLKYRERSPQKI